jgi:hypothetical protein
MHAENRGKLLGLPLLQRQQRSYGASGEDQAPSPLEAN